MNEFKVIRSEIGVLKLDDGTTAYLRVIITRIKEGGRLPTGLQLNIGHSVIIDVNSPDELKEVVKDKPIPMGDEHEKRLDIWKKVNIRDVKPASEEVEYIGSDGVKYVIGIQIEPVFVVRTLEYRDNIGNPIYYIRWSPKTFVKPQL